MSLEAVRKYAMSLEWVEKDAKPKPSKPRGSAKSRI